MLLYIQLKNSSAVIPSRAHKTDIGYDLTAIRNHKVWQVGLFLYDTGIAVAPPQGFYLEILPRSSLSKTGYMLANSVGTIDPDYRGNLFIALNKVNPSAPDLKLPFCKCQLVLRHAISADVKVVENLDSTERGSGSFGSTGNTHYLGMVTALIEKKSNFIKTGSSALASLTGTILVRIVIQQTNPNNLSRDGYPTGGVPAGTPPGSTLLPQV